MKSLCAAGLLTFVLPVSALALDPAPASTLRVKIYPDQYVIAEARFDNLDGVDAQIRRTGAHMLMLESCASASGKRLAETIDRFRTGYATRIEVGALPANDAGCQPPMLERDAPRATFPWP